MSYTRSISPLPETEFPRGLRVLAVDANIVCLRLLVQMLQRCDYEVTSTTNHKEALEKLREDKSNFDIVITDNMDGFSFMAIVALETELPVIVISCDDHNDTVIKGIRQGACEFIAKPVSLRAIENIWHHVVRKALYKPDKSCIMINEKNVSNSDGPDKQIQTDQLVDTEESCPHKKASRLVWTPELHNKFVDAIKELGHKASPQNILKVMKEPGVTRLNVASHLQKFRSQMESKNKQEGNMIKAAGSNRRHYSMKNRALTKYNDPAVITLGYPDFARLQNAYRHTQREPSSSQYRYHQQLHYMNNQQNMMLQNQMMMMQPRNRY